MPPKRAAAVDAAKKMTAKAPTHVDITKTVTGRVKKTKAPAKPTAAATKVIKATGSEPKTQKGKRNQKATGATKGTRVHRTRFIHPSRANMLDDRREAQGG